MAADAVRGQGPVPEAPEHQRVGGLPLGSIIKHGDGARVLQRGSGGKTSSGAAVSVSDTLDVLDQQSLKLALWAHSAPRLPLSYCASLKVGEKSSERVPQIPVTADGARNHGRGERDADNFRDDDSEWTRGEKPFLRNNRRSALPMINIAFPLLLLTLMMTIWRASTWTRATRSRGSTCCPPTGFLCPFPAQSPP